MAKGTRRHCVVEGCEWRAHSAIGYCGKHYTRWKKYGDPLAYASYRYRYTNGGYIYLYRPAHPMADKTGRVAEHRLVLSEKTGPGAHPCHWCGLTVSWDKKWPGDRDALVPDHLNGDRADNRPENLVPSCQPCNVSRPAP
jgi:hypothetical protein